LILEREKNSTRDGDQVIKSVCCKCGEWIGTKDDGREGVRISHGYCKICAAVELAKIVADAEKMETVLTRQGVEPGRVF